MEPTNQLRGIKGKPSSITPPGDSLSALLQGRPVGTQIESVSPVTSVSPGYWRLTSTPAQHRSEVRMGAACLDRQNSWVGGCGVQGVSGNRV